MKIGMVFPSVEYGGQEKNLIKLSNELHDNNYEIEILTYGNKKFTTARATFICAYVLGEEYNNLPEQDGLLKEYIGDIYE
jgi:hypothetical protein